MSHTLSWNK